jgi:ABC-type polysaccharide/polyol phosphate export permease
MMSAESLARGSGLAELSGLPLTQFPPLYSMILTAGSVIFGADVFRVGWFLCILAFAAVIWFSGILFMQVFRDEPVLAYLAAFVVASSSSLIQISQISPRTRSSC